MWAAAAVTLAPRPPRAPRGAQRSVCARVPTMHTDLQLFLPCRSASRFNSLDHRDPRKGRGSLYIPATLGQQDEVQVR